MYAFLGVRIENSRVRVIFIEKNFYICVFNIPKSCLNQKQNKTNNQ